MTEQKTDRASWLKGPQAHCRTTLGRPNRPWRLVLLGAPGIGKGTQAAMICHQYHACHLSTGDVFRDALTSSCGVSPAMEDALAYMKRGDLVPDETVIEMVRERSQCLSCSFGFLLDGFPRTVPQAKALEKTLAECDQKIDAVLAYEMPIEKIVERLSGRRTCSECKRTYHTVSMPPQKEGVCDTCGGELVQRDDDKPEAVTVRMAAYEESTSPLTEYYEANGLLRRIPGEGTPEEVFERTRAVIEDLDPSLAAAAAGN